MSGSINAIGASMTVGATQSTTDVSIKVGKATELSKSMRLLAGDSLTVSESTYGAVAEHVIDTENSTPEGREKSEVAAGKAPVKKDVFFNMAGERVEDYL